MSAILSQLHWLRPDWLWALAALPVLVWWWGRRRSRGNVWKQAVDTHLLPHLLEKRVTSRGLTAAVIAGAGFVLAVLAMAGPSWREVQQPLWTQQSPLVLAVDLSSASRASDVPPSRMARSRAKIATLLEDRPGGQVGLVAYAGEAFTVAPLTSDTANVALFLDALDPDVMPVDGQRADKAIAWSARLLNQAGFQHGTVLLLADHATPAAVAESARVHAAGYTVSVLGLGTATGAPYRNGAGEMVLARRDDASLQRLADAGGGRYAALSEGDADLASLGVLEARVGVAGGAKSDGTVTTRQDEGYWLLLPLMLLGLFAFRRGAPVLLLVVFLWLPGRGAQAAELWQRADQRTHKTMEEAAGAYRRGEFAAAATLYGKLDGAEADYNRGNALAREGKYAEAVAAYDKALQARPDMEDAIANRQAVQAAMKRKPPPGQSDGGGGKGASDRKQDGGGDPESGKDDSDAGTSAPPPSDDPDSASKGRNSSDQQGHSSTGDEGRSADEDGDGAAETDAQEAGQQPRGTDGRSGPARKQPPPLRSDGEAQDAGAADAEAQQAADEAQRARMRDALQRNEQGTNEAGNADEADAKPESADERERRIANEAWLRRIPDDPGGLLRRKFQLEYERRQREGSTQ